MSQTKRLVDKRLKNIEAPTRISGAEFEQIVYEASVESAKETQFENKLRKTDDREFPDIVDDEYFGVEVKVTKKDAWTSVGNSVLESSRVLNTEKIYVFFGKMGGTPDTNFRSYEECLKGIAVTHYPRYQIDMVLPVGESIFDKMKIPYDALRREPNPVKNIRAYYRSQLKDGQELWWINDNLDDATAPPIIKTFTSLSSEEKSRIKAEIFIYFPEVVSSNSTKFSKIAAFLVSNHGVISSNLRDNFSAGGQVVVKAQGQEFKAPQIVAEIIRMAPQIQRRLETLTTMDLANIWEKKVQEEDSVAAWKKEIDYHSRPMELKVPVSSLFDQAL